MVRRAMSKKKHSVMEQERKNFIYGIVDEEGNVEVPGCLRNGISEKAANDIFDSMMDFASYAFNKSHAAAYAVVGYQTAYLMHYYPVETIAAMLKAVGSEKKALIVLPEKNEKVIASAANIPGVKTALVNTLNVYDILNADKFIVLQDAIAQIEEVYA